jgi:hypothetical protein
LLGDYVFRALVIRNVPHGVHGERKLPAVSERRIEREPVTSEIPGSILGRISFSSDREDDSS